LNHWVERWLRLYIILLAYSLVESMKRFSFRKLFLQKAINLLHLVWILFLVELRDSLTVFLFVQILWLLRRIVGVVSHSFLTGLEDHPGLLPRECFRLQKAA
jgi:hypothetical protein